MVFIRQKVVDILDLESHSRLVVVAEAAEAEVEDTQELMVSQDRQEMMVSLVLIRKQGNLEVQDMVSQDSQDMISAIPLYYRDIIIFIKSLARG